MPPATFNAPVVKLEESVVSVIITGSLNVESPSTSKLVETLTLALISKSLPKTDNPMTSRFPTCTRLENVATPTTSKSTLGKVLPIPTLLTPLMSLKTKLDAPPIFPTAL